MLTDAGPLVALVNTRDRNHHPCREALATIRGPLVTVLPAFTEAMHIVHREGGWSAQAKLWHFFELGQLVMAGLDDTDLDRSRELMGQYRDVPMDFADATLVALAEHRKLHEVFTLDRRGFLTYRLRGRGSFTLLP